jgi:hypothetical protein
MSTPDLESLRRVLGPMTFPLTARKAAQLIGKDYQVTGFILCNEKGERALVETNAVRYLSNKEMWDLMHPPTEQHK